MINIAAGAQWRNEQYETRAWDPAVGSFTGTFCGTHHDNLRPGRCTFPRHVLPRETPETIPTA